MGLLFEDAFKTFNEDLWMTVSKLDNKRRVKPFDVSKHIKQWLITDILTRAIASGNWTIKRFRMQRQGVTQLVSRLSYMAAYGHMTRVTSLFEKTRKVSALKLVMLYVVSTFTEILHNISQNYLPQCYPKLVSYNLLRFENMPITLGGPNAELHCQIF